MTLQRVQQSLWASGADNISRCSREPLGPTGVILIARVGDQHGSSGAKHCGTPGDHASGASVFCTERRTWNEIALPG